MTLFTIFQWSLSPSGNFQLARSFPLNKDINPSGIFSSLSCARVVPVITKMRREKKRDFICKHFCFYKSRLLLVNKICPPHTFKISSSSARIRLKIGIFQQVGTQLNRNLLQGAEGLF